MKRKLVGTAGVLMLVIGVLLLMVVFGEMNNPRSLATFAAGVLSLLGGTVALLSFYRVEMERPAWIGIMMIVLGAALMTVVLGDMSNPLVLRISVIGFLIMLVGPVKYPIFQEQIL